MGSQSSTDAVCCPCPPPPGAHAKCENVNVVAQTSTDAVAAGDASQPEADALSEYVDRAALLNELRRQNVRLVKPGFLIRHFQETSDPLPNRQGLPEDAFLDVNALKPEDLARMEVIAISYCWLHHDHPDPNRYHLETLVRMLQLYCRSSADNADFWYYIGGVNQSFARLRDDFGFSLGGGDGRPVGIFLDWLSLFQDKPKKRTQEQSEIFNAALKNINLWYAHQDTIVWVLSSLPTDVRRAGYHQSGWTTFERAVTAILTPGHKLLDITGDIRAKLVSEQNFAKHYVDLALKTMDTTRGVPQEPGCFNERIADKHFTNGADKDAIVKPKYERTFKAVIMNAASLTFFKVGFGDTECRQLMQVATRHCTRLRALDLSGNKIDTALDVFAGFIRQHHLKSINLAMNFRLSGDIGSLAACASLTMLDLSRTSIAGNIASLGVMTQLTVLNLEETKVSGNIASLATLTKLTDLNLCTTDIEGNVGSLTKMTQIVVLALVNTNIGGEVAQLAQLTHIKKLYIGKTRISGDLASLSALRLQYDNFDSPGLFGKRG